MQEGEIRQIVRDMLDVKIDIHHDYEEDFESYECSQCECYFANKYIDRPYLDNLSPSEGNNSTKPNKYSRACTRFCAQSSDISQEEVTDESKKRILKVSNTFAEMYKGLNFFEINNHDIEIESGCLDKLTDLREIQLIKNRITSIPPAIYNHKQLEVIRIIGNPVKSISAKEDLFENLPNLKYLELSFLKLNAKSQSKESIKLPSSLVELSLIGLPVDFMIFDLTNCSKSLKKVTFRGVSWVNIYDYGGNNAILSTDHCIFEMNTRNLIFTRKQINSLIQKFDDNGNGFLETEEVIKLNAYIFKNFLRLGLNLTKDEQNVQSGIPSSIFTCVNLVELDLSYQAIRLIPDEIENLKNLKKLNLSNCILLHTISAKCSNLDLIDLQLENCMSLKTPPLEITKRGFTAVMAYLKRLSMGSVSCKKTKLMLVIKTSQVDIKITSKLLKSILIFKVGLGEAGKTSLLNALSKKDEHDSPDITDGINIKEWEINLPDNTTITYSMWDFGKKIQISFKLSTQVFYEFTISSWSKCLL